MPAWRTQAAAAVCGSSANRQRLRKWAGSISTVRCRECNSFRPSHSVRATLQHSAAGPQRQIARLSSRASPSEQRRQGVAVLSPTLSWPPPTSTRQMRQVPGVVGRRGWVHSVGTWGHSGRRYVGFSRCGHHVKSPSAINALAGGLGRCRHQAFVAPRRSGKQRAGCWAHIGACFAACGQDAAALGDLHLLAVDLRLEVRRQPWPSLRARSGASGGRRCRRRRRQPQLPRSRAHLDLDPGVGLCKLLRRRGQPRRQGFERGHSYRPGPGLREQARHGVGAPDQGLHGARGAEPKRDGGCKTFEPFLRSVWRLRELHAAMRS